MTARGLWGPAWQARTRQYRDAYETTAAELAAAKARLSELEKRCSPPR